MGTLPAGDGKDAEQVQIVPSLTATPTLMASTVPGNGDVNPYGVAFVPRGFAAGGPLKTGDVLVSNFNNSTNPRAPAPPSSTSRPPASSRSSSRVPRAWASPPPLAC